MRESERQVSARFDGTDATAGEGEAVEMSTSHSRQADE